MFGHFKGMKIKPGSMEKPSPAFVVKVSTYTSGEYLTI